MKRNQGKRILAVLLSLMLMMSNLGLQAFAEEFTSTPTDLEENQGEVIIDEDIFSSDIEVLPEEVELQLGEDLFDGGDALTVWDAPEDSLLIDEDLFTSDPVYEEETLPFAQTYTVGNREITITADAGVFSADAVLYVDSIDDAGIAHAAEDVMGVSVSDTMLISHTLYSFSGTEMYGTANVKMQPVGFGALWEAYPGASITSYIVCWDGDYQETRMIPADFDTEQDKVEFALPAMTVYDLLTVARLPEQESTETAAEEQAEPSSDVQEEEVIAQFPEGQIEETAEQTSEDHVEDESTESSVDEAFVEDDTVEFYPVSVVFDAMPETAVVTVWPAATEEVPAPEAIPAQEDGSFALLPGEYTYTAEAEGYVSLENVPFTVTGDEQPLLLSFALEAVPEPVAFDQSQTVSGVKITVKADEGVFPEGAELSVERVPVYQQAQADAAVEEVRDENVNVAVSYTFDIKVIDPATGEEFQPAEGQTVNVSFALAEVADENLETSVYHIDDSGAAEKLDVTQEDEVTASVETEGFSLYTVEFTYNTLEYVLPGDSSVPMSEILSALGLTGAVEAVEISNENLFTAWQDAGAWVVQALKPFSTTEWMKVTINGVAYEITVTDTDLSGFLDCSSGSAMGYFTYSDHFYKVEWTGINTTETSSVQLQYSSSYGRLEAYRNGNSSSSTMLYPDASTTSTWPTSSITGLTPGQSSSGYTSYDKLATGASTNSRKKVCTVTCVAALKPTWNWSSDHSTCTATFMCAENTSLTATINATVTSSSEPYAANVTFNGTSYSYVAPVTYSITYVLNGGTNADSNPNTYRDDETVTLSDPTRTGYIFEGWYDNAGFNGTAVTGIPYDSSGAKTFYAKWKSEIDGLTYDEEIGGFVIDSVAALTTLANYSQSNNCNGKTFKQTADITLSGSFTGIGCYDHPFSGTYDGGDHYITGLYEKKYVNYLGLFLMTDGATIRNVRLVSPYIDSSNTAGTSFCDGIGGLIGSSDKTTVSDCYVLDPTVKGNSGWSGAIIGWGSVSGNFYYTENDALPAVGKGNSTATRLRKLTLPGGVTGGSVTASSGVQLNYNGALYCAENASVTLTITPERGYILSALTVNETNVTGSVSNNSYTFNMPTEDITVTAAFVKETFTYVDTNGVTQTVEAERITSDSAVGLYSGWYAVGGNVTRDSGFNLVAGGDGVVINIILCDGATLNLPNSTINTAGGGKPNLVIWGQENGTGALSCMSISDKVTSVTVNGGQLRCGVSNYNCAINGDLIVNGGEVHLTAGFNTCVNGSVTYNGGILDTKKITGNTTLNWSNAATDGVKVSDFGGSVTIADGKFFKDASGNYYYGSLTDAQKNAIKNVELQPAPNAHAITVEQNIAHGTVTAAQAAESNQTVAVTVTPETGYEAVSVKYNGNDVTKTDDTHFTFTMPASDVTITASFQPITYTITYNGVEGATFAASNPASYTIEGEAITLNNPTKTGYTFAGWTGTGLDGATETVTIPTGSTGDRTYTANWTTHTYSVQFNGNGATDGEMSALSFTYDEPAKALTANAYARTGYTFTGWNTAADGSGTAYTDEQAVQNLTAENGAAVTLYAQWTANTYTIRFVAVIPVNGSMTDQTFTYDQPATALTKNAFSTTTGEWLRWNTEADGSGTDYADEAQVQNLTDVDGAVITLYAQWHLQHRFNYDNSVFRCYTTNNTNEVYWAYAGETVKVEVTDGTSEYTIYVTGEDGTDITFDTEANTFLMPDQEVYITSTSVKKMAYTTIFLDDFDSWENVAYLYDASNPTVTPAVVVKDGETTLTEGTDYTLEITNNTGSADRMVEATVTITGKGGYVGTNEKTFRITPFNITDCEIKGKLEAYDDGYGVYYPLERNVEVWNGETQLKAGTDYSLDIVYADSYEVGQTYQATVKGTGDWGGTKTFTFTVIELSHTVVFNANGGTGTMADDTATKGQHYDLPACGFTAPEGKTFDHWIASCEEGEEKQPGDYFTAPYIYNESDVQTITVTAYWRDKVQYTVTATGMEHGSLAVNGETITLTNGAVAIYEGDTVAVDPQEGYALDTLTVTDANSNPVTVTDNQFTMPAGNVTVTATFKEYVGPKFKVQSLRLSGEIGVNFYMDLSMLTEEQREASYVTFTVGSSADEIRADYNENAKNRTNVYYGFTCYVNAIQMADTITATYHYTADGTEYTVQKTYSVQQYIDACVGSENITEAELALIKAMKDYGYYSQQYLSVLRGFTIGSDYAGISAPYAASYDTASMKANTEKYKIEKTLVTEDISKATYSLALDSNTSIYLYIKPAEGYSGSISATVDGNAADAVLRSDGRYRITIPGISAHKLGDTYEVAVVTEHGTSTIRVSVMSYVYACLDQPLSDAETKAVAALYSYYMAADSYKKANP